MRTRNTRSKIRERMTYAVRVRPGHGQQGLLVFGNAVLPCALGRSGTRTRKREGDGATPVGAWQLIEVRYRDDRVSRPCTRLPVRATRKRHGWCDASGDRNYNRGVVLPYPRSAEAMWRDDHLYDIVIVLSHNTRPRARGLGSAVFVHLARAGYSPTEGCVALSLHDMRRVLARCRPGDVIAILS